MNENNLTILPPEEMPETDPAKPKKPRVNCLQEMVIEFMDEFGLRDADMVRGTGTPWPTWFGWISGDVNCQLADKNLLNLWRFINTYKKMSLEYLLYGIGEDGSEENESA